MAIVITNGTHYIYLNKNGKHRKTSEYSKAYKYDDASLAIQYMHHAPAKTKGYFVYDTETKKIIWKWLSDKERIEKCIVKNKRFSQNSKRHPYSLETRKMIYDKYHGRCQLCGKKLQLSTMTLDHIVPISMGGRDDISNLWIACKSCNFAKADCMPEKFLDRIWEIFTYQMEKKYRYDIRWKCIKRLLKTLR